MHKMARETENHKPPKNYAMVYKRWKPRLNLNYRSTQIECKLSLHLIVVVVPVIVQIVKWFEC